MLSAKDTAAQAFGERAIWYSRTAGLIEFVTEYTDLLTVSILGELETNLA